MLHCLIKIYNLKKINIDRKNDFFSWNVDL